MCTHVRQTVASEGRPSDRALQKEGNGQKNPHCHGVNPPPFLLSRSPSANRLGPGPSIAMATGHFDSPPVFFFPFFSCCFVSVSVCGSLSPGHGVLPVETHVSIEPRVVRSGLPPPILHFFFILFPPPVLIFTWSVEGVTAAFGLGAPFRGGHFKSVRARIRQKTAKCLVYRRSSSNVVKIALISFDKAHRMTLVGFSLDRSLC